MRRVRLERCLIDRTGEPRQNLLAVGAKTRGAFWEITSVSDLRLQARAVAQTIRQQVGGSVDAFDGAL